MDFGLCRARGTSIRLLVFESILKRCLDGVAGKIEDTTARPTAIRPKISERLCLISLELKLVSLGATTPAHVAHDFSSFRIRME